MRNEKVMQKVKREQYSDFIELAKANTCNTVYPMSVAEGVQSGDIYTDDLNAPQYALFWHVSGFAYLTGQPKKEELDEIYALMKNESGKNPRRFVLEIKDEQTASYFQKKEDVEIHPRYGFRLKELKPEGEIPEGYELKEIDEKLFSEIKGKIVPSSFWSSAEDFMTKGKGYCLMQGGEAAAAAFSAAVSSNQVDIGIETREEHRRKGLAAVVAKKMAAYALSIGKEPVWDCEASNIGSRATAEKIGFKIVAEYAYYKV